jgi:SAM-dependent methyltransferase
MTQKLVLDATAGYRMMHMNKKNPNVLYIDQRFEVKPDEVQDFRKLPYPDESFQLIIFDPPHLKDDHHDPKIKLNSDYGLLISETWQSDLKKGFAELWRVLKVNGVLVFKWNDHDIRCKHVLTLFPVEPIIGQVANGDRKLHKSRSCTVWFTFMKFTSSEKNGVANE